MLPAAEVASILRLHIIGIAMTACVGLGWLITDRFPVAAALIGGVDWCLINLLNRITDLKEDLANQIRGTERVAAHRRAFVGGWVALFVVSFAVSLPLYPELTWLRLVVQGIGLGYSVAFVPTLRGLKRFKDLYFFKNFMSSVLFVLTTVGYPLAVDGWVPALPNGWVAVGLLVAFFVYHVSEIDVFDIEFLLGTATGREFVVFLLKDFFVYQVLSTQLSLMFGVFELVNGELIEL